MSLFSILDVSSSGLSAQRTRVEVLAQNIANAETTRAADGGPYRRKRVVFEAERRSVTPFGAVLARVVRPVDRFFDPETRGVRIAEFSVDDGPPDKRYQPHHPDADAEGYVAYPSFNPVEDMIDLTAVVRSYQANLAVIASVKEMVARTIDIARS